MLKPIFILLLVLAIGHISCTMSGMEEKSKQANTTDDLIFPKGVKLDDERFSGTAWLESLVVSDSTNHIAVSSVTFEPGSRTKWHLHPDGQIIMAIGGVGYYQVEGSPKKILKKGDVATCPPDVPHWHGASSDEEFIQIAIETLRILVSVGTITCMRTKKRFTN